ncbi:MAG: dTDP-glucose 4,6-dehydratase [Gammaproteobacteria bacterium]|nr:dTDP-glucose 4,6-dehydratase [Gammaproteobacteria bacterium]
MRIMVTGGAGFIGSALVRHLVLERGDQVCTIDKLTYSGSVANLDAVEASPLHELVELDICDGPAVREVMLDFRPDAVLHLAAESHVDRSIDGPEVFVRTNVLGTCNMLQAALELHRGSSGGLRFVHVSTDEVFGSLGESGYFLEDDPYQPNSPYSATKAGADHLARAWHVTFGLPVVVTNCSNNYGPRQFPEKLIPLTILNGLAGRACPVYGDGRQVRDWLFVEDHVTGLVLAMEKGVPGRSYNFGGRAERRNIEVVRAVLESVADCSGKSRSELLDLIEFVSDRPGHDRRYAIDPTRAESELTWHTSVDFEEGIQRTVRWYLDNREWCEAMSRRYGGDRLGKAGVA